MGPQCQMCDDAVSYCAEKCCVSMCLHVVNAVTGVVENVDISIKKLVAIVTLLNKYSKTVFCP